MSDKDTTIVAKFGGSSLSNPKQWLKVIEIIRSDPARKHIVVSAPGKRNDKDKKITDLLYEWYRLVQLNLSAVEIQRKIRDRFLKITVGLNINFDIMSEINVISAMLKSGAEADYVASRGEYLSGKIMALALNYEFIDPATFIKFNYDGTYSINEAEVNYILSNKKTVIPGFYGSLPDGSIKTFTRNGSDITGAIVAAAIKAKIYENWTDVSGVYMADPRIVKNPSIIRRISYWEMYEMCHGGAGVFHPEASIPVRKSNIPTNIRNTNHPEEPGTMIVESNPTPKSDQPVTGIAGRKDFTLITIKKMGISKKVGFLRKVLSILEESKINIEHIPDGVDTITLVVADSEFKGKHEDILEKIKSACNPDSIELEKANTSLIAVVGQAMLKKPGIASRIFQVLAENEINIRLISQGANEINILIGVFNPDFFIKISKDGTEYFVIVEIKSDKDYSDENKAKYKYAKDHFERLNEKLEENKINQKYIFHFLSPEGYTTFFEYLKDGRILDGQEKFRCELENLLETENDEE